MKAGKPILITGSHRSGSTWTGRMISASSNVLYLQEPFNGHYFNPGICSYYFEEQFQYINQENGAEFSSHLRRTVELKYNLLAGLQFANNSRQYFKVFSDSFAFTEGRLKGKRPLFKDPFALFSAPWLAHEYNMDIVILIRHPAAFVSSVKRMQWESPVHLLRHRENLMHDYFEPLRYDMDIFLAEPRTIVEQAAFFWKIAYYAVHLYQQLFPHWHYARHEDLSKDPILGFQTIFNYLSIPYSQSIQKRIKKYTNAKNPREAPEQQTIYQLNSTQNILNWKHRLTPEEIKQVRTLTSGVWEHFYTAEDW